MDRDQQQRERAYKIWEEEARVEGSHGDHWKCAKDSGELYEQETQDVTAVNQQADDEFERPDGRSRSAADMRPPSTVSSD